MLPTPFAATVSFALVAPPQSDHFGHWCGHQLLRGLNLAFFNNKCFKIITALRIERAAFCAACAHSLPQAPQKVDDQKTR